jgi:hypothetical protein
MEARVRLWETGWLVNGLAERPVAVVAAPAGRRAGVSAAPGALAFVSEDGTCSCGAADCLHRRAVRAVQAAGHDPFTRREPAVLYLEPQVETLVTLGRAERALGYRVVRSASLEAVLQLYPRLLPMVVRVSPALHAAARAALLRLDPAARVEAGDWS